MENFIPYLLKKLIESICVLASLGLLGKAAIMMQQKAHHQLTTQILSLSSLQHQLQRGSR